MEKKHQRYQRLLDRCKSLPSSPAAVAHPRDESSLKGAVETAELKLLQPILAGPRNKIESLAKQLGIDVSRYEILEAPHSHASAEAAVRLVREGKAEMLMIGRVIPWTM